MSKTKIILNNLLSLILTFLLTLFIFLIIIKSSIFNKNYIYNVLINNNYYEDIYNEINEEFENTIISSGFTNDILKDVLNKEEVKNDINLFIENIYNNKLTILDKENIKDKLNSNIEKFMKDNNLVTNSSREIQEMVNDLTDIYINEICLYNYINPLINNFYKLSSIINKAIIISSIVIMLLFIILKLILKTNNISSIIGAVSLNILFVRIFIFEKLDIEYLLVITEKFSNIVRIILSQIGNVMLIIGVILMIIFGIMACKVLLKKEKSIVKMKINKYN